MSTIRPPGLPVSATKEFFPDQNPNPVLRLEGDGRLSYANAAAEPLVTAWGVHVGDELPRAVTDAIRAAAAATPPDRVEVEVDRQTFAVLPIYVPDLGAFNLYGTDITGAKVVERFPGRNPNPVLRMTPDGHLWYANDASAPITRSLGVGIGDPLPAGLVSALQAHLADPASPSPEVPG